MRVRLSSAWPWWLLIAALWLWGLGDLGIASNTEAPVLARAQRWLGAPHGALARAPEFPDWLRSLALGLDAEPLRGSNLGHALSKLPNLGCALGLLCLAWSWGKHMGLSGIGCMALLAAFPVSSIATRHLVPDLWGELALSLLLWSRHCRPFGPRRRALLEILSFGLLLHCAGLWWGLGVAATLLWLEEDHRSWGFLAIAAALTSVLLAFSIGADYHPWLAAARDPRTLYELPPPFTRAMMGILSDFGLWIPWLGFAWLKADAKLSLERRWLALIWGSQVISSVAFGPGPLIGLLPASILLVNAATKAHRSWSFETLCITSLIGWALLLRTLPHFADQLAWPHTLAQEFGPEIPKIEQVWLVQTALMLAMLAVLRLARRPQPWFFAGLIFSVALQAQLGSRRLAEQGSLRSLTKALDLIEAKGANIASYGVEDPGWALYAQPSWPRLRSMQQAIEHLQKSSDSTLVLSQESAKQLAGRLSHFGAPLRKLAVESPEYLVLIHSQQTPAPQAPSLPAKTDSMAAGALAQNSVLSHPFRAFEPLTKIPPLAHRCRIVFDDSLELLAWQLTKPLARGKGSEFQAVFRVLKPLKGHLRIVPTLRGKPFSPWPSFESPSSTDTFPISAWQQGDLILFRKVLEVPLLLTSSGPLELRIGLARSQYSYRPITFPAGELPEKSGLRWVGKKHRRIVLDTVELENWWD